MNASLKSVVFIGIAALFAVSCSRKVISGHEKLAKIKTADLVSHLETLSNPEWSFLSTKITTKFNSKDQKQSFKTSLKMKRDSLINVTITFAAIPVINAILSPDSLKVVNKKDKCFFLEEINFLKQQFDIPFEYSQVEQLILGLPLALDPDTKYRQLDDPFYYIISSHRKRFINNQHVKSDDDILMRYFLSPEKLDLAQIILESPLDSTSIRVQYFERYEESGFRLPHRTEIDIVTPRDTISIELKFQKPEIEKEKTIFLTIPDSYEKCN